MKTYLILSLCLFQLCFYSFTQAQNTETVQTDWIKALSEGGDLNAFYNDQSGILLNREVYLGASEIGQQLQAYWEDDPLVRFEHQYVRQLRDQQKFESGIYETKSGKLFQTIIGWQWKETWTKTFEVIHPLAPDLNNDENIVDKGREKWVMHSNEHRPDLIAQQVFSASGKYFNRGKVYPQSEIAGAYSYMNNENYVITLEPQMVKRVDERTVFEIGIFKVGGQGLYTLIWIKENNEWKLLLDFNF